MEKEPLISSNQTSQNYSSSQVLVVNSTHHVSHADEHVYKRRWWILVVFSIGGFTQSLMWNTLAPITFAIEIGFGWTDAFTALTAGLSDFAFFLSALILMYIVETRGLRIVTILVSVFLVLNMSMWILAFPLKTEGIVYFGTFFGGMAGAIFMSAPSLLSSIWFPVSERTTATSISAASTYFGTAGGFITGPYISGKNVSSSDVSRRDSLPESFKESLRVGIENVMYFDAGLAVLVCVCVFIYFPDRPPKPPSHSATIERTDFRHGLKRLFKNVTFWLILLAFNLPNAAFNTWIPLVSTSFKDLKVSETTAGWVGFATLLSGAASSILISIFVDHFKRKMKIFIGAMTLGQIIMIIVLLLLANQYIKVSPAQLTGTLFATAILAGITVNSIIPLYYELLCECAYPVHEGLACIISTMSNNLVGAIMFILLQNDTLAKDTIWMMWTCLATSVISFPLLMFAKVNFNRLDIEDEISNGTETQEE